MSNKNGGQVSRDALGQIVNDAQDAESKRIHCHPQIVGDVIEQRDNLLAAVEDTLDALMMYASVDRTNPPAWFKVRYAKLYAAIALAKGK